MRMESATTVWAVLSVTVMRALNWTTRARHALTSMNVKTDLVEEQGASTAPGRTHASAGEETGSTAKSYKGASV